MNVTTRQPMTQDQFFAWAQAHEGRYEFDGIRPVAMTGGTGNHGLIAGNIMYQLKTRLRGSRCVPTGSEGPGIRTIGARIRYPDAVVTCTKFGGRDRLIPSPVVVFEVLSDTSLHTDRVLKLREYLAVPSIKQYVLLEQMAVGVTAYARPRGEPQDGGVWTVTPLLAGDMLELPEIGIRIPVGDIYEGVGFDEPQDGAAADEPEQASAAAPTTL